mmetsp:Transcript_83475/g.147152  ORF Transcript_83475/g.147152 Transcript_83475/m.147152 type:complete len:103 (-) Transcript_83475:208-516(-)
MKNYALTQCPWWPDSPKKTYHCNCDLGQTLTPSTSLDNSAGFSGPTATRTTEETLYFVAPFLFLIDHVLFLLDKASIRLHFVTRLGVLFKLLSLTNHTINHS